MSNEKFTQLPTVTTALAADIICAVQGGVSVQETLQQVLNLALAQTILSHAGNPNGLVAGSIYQLLWDTTDSSLWVCTTTGNAASAVWTQVAPSNASPISPSLGGTGVSNPTAHTLPVAEGSSNFNFLGPMTDGQVLIGSTGANPVPALPIAGTGITLSFGPGSMTISATGATGFAWTVVASSSQSMAAQNGYITNNGASLVTYTLPLTANVGDTIVVLGDSSGGWTIAQNAGQSIAVSGLTSTVGVGGSVSSSNEGDAITLVCIVANTEFRAQSLVGNLTIV